jgi:hypothetical protein
VRIEGTTAAVSSIYTRVQGIFMARIAALAHLLKHAVELLVEKL